MAYTLDVFMADTSSLKNRALVFAFSNTPYIATTFIGPSAAASFLKTSGWPWAFGSFAIITPVIALPIITILWRNQRKAIREGLLIRRERSGRTFFQNVNYYFWEFDSEPLEAFVNMFCAYISHSYRSASCFCRLFPRPSPFLAFLIPDQEMGLAARNFLLRCWGCLPYRIYTL